jgi:hypothetical protein
MQADIFIDQASVPATRLIGEDNAPTLGVWESEKRHRHGGCIWLQFDEHATLIAFIERLQELANDAVALQPDACIETGVGD